jgi:hypothetical protein
MGLGLSAGRDAYPNAPTPEAVGVDTANNECPRYIGARG